MSPLQIIMVAIVAAVSVFSGLAVIDPVESDQIPHVDNVDNDQLYDDSEHYSQSFCDDFNDPNSGWATYDDKQGEVQFGYQIDDEDERYHVQISGNERDVLCPNYTIGEYSDFVVEVDAWLDTEQAYGVYGLLFRHCIPTRDELRGYWFQVSTEGEYRIVEITEIGGFTILADWKESPHINKGSNRINRLGVRCVGPEIRVYVNSEYITSVVSDSFESGFVGLFAGSSDKNNVKFYFDNFCVRYHESTSVTPTRESTLSPVPSPTLTPLAKPDLVIKDISSSPRDVYAGDTLTFTITIKNEGTRTAGPSTVEYYIDGSYIGSDKVNSITAQGTTRETFTWRAQAGTHRVKIIADSHGSVFEMNEFNNQRETTISIEGIADTDSDGGDIQSGETQKYSIDSSTDTDAFTFSGQKGQAIIIRMSQESGGVDPSVDLYAPDGSLEHTAGSGSSKSVRVKEHKLQQSGTYTIVARDYDGKETGQYSLSLLLLPGATSSSQDPDGGEIKSAETKTGTIDLNADTDAFTFSGKKGQAIILRMSQESGGVDPSVDLYAPDGSLEHTAGTSSSRSVRIKEYKLQQSGTYTIIARDYDGEETGQYGLSLLLLPGATSSSQDPDGGEIKSAETKTGTIDLNADTDAFTFHGQKGQTILLRMSQESGGVDPSIDLYAPDGTLEHSKGSSSSTRATITDWILQESGKYTVVCRDYDGEETGGYSLSFQLILPLDLVVNIGWSPSHVSPGDNVSVIISVINMGPGSADNFTVRYYVNGIYRDSDTIDLLRAGEVYNTVFSLSVSHSSLRVKAVVDYNDTVTETNEDNNEMEVYIKR